MAYDDQRGRTSSFQQGLHGKVGGGPIYDPGPGDGHYDPSAGGGSGFLGGEAGGFLQGGGSGGGFTNFSSFLLANPTGAGGDAGGGTPGQNGIDSAMNTALGFTAKPTPATDATPAATAATPSTDSAGTQTVPWVGGPHDWGHPGPDPANYDPNGSTGLGSPSTETGGSTGKDDDVFTKHLL